jgi:hypothetical protein
MGSWLVARRVLPKVASQFSLFKKQGGGKMPENGIPFNVVDEQQTKLKEMGIHQIKIEKYLSEDGEELVCKMSLNDSLKNLLSAFIVKGQYSTEDYDGQKVKRLKIKSVLRNSQSWNNSFVYFFTKECVEDGVYEMKFTNVTSFQNFVAGLRYFKDLIRIMEELKRKETMVVSYKLER